MMRNRRIIINISVIIIALFCFALWYSIFISKTIPTSSKTKRYKVYLITTDKEYQYWDYINQGASDMANSLGVVQYIWDAPTKRNVDEQIKVIYNAVEQGADALLVAADDIKELSGVVEDAKANSVKVIYVDAQAYEEAIVALSTDNYAAGVKAGQQMLKELTDNGKTQGAIGIVNVAKKSNETLREQAFRNTIKGDGRFTVLDTVYTNGNKDVSMEAAKQLIVSNSDLVGLFGTNEGTSEGIGNAIKENNNRYIGIGFDRTDAMMKLIKNGNLKAIIVQNPYTMGYLGMAEAFAALQGKDTGPSFIDTGFSIIESKQ